MTGTAVCFGAREGTATAKRHRSRRQWTALGLSRSQTPRDAPAS